MSNIVKRPNGKWRARYRDADGKEHAKHFDRKVDGQRWLDEQTAGLVTGQWVDPQAGKMCFRAYAEPWRAAQVHRPSTTAHVETMLRRHVYPTFGERQLGSIRPSEVQAWVKRLSLTLAPATVQVVHGIVASIFKAAIRDKKLTGSPCEGTTLPAGERVEVVPLSTDVVLAIEAALPHRYRALVTVAAGTGLRQGEAFGLTVDRSGLRPLSVRPALRVEQQLVLVQKEPPFLAPPKTKASRRTVPLPRVVANSLAAHLAAFPAIPQEITCRDATGKAWREVVELVFTDDGDPIRRTDFSRIWRQAVKAAGAPVGTTCHDLRHYYASLLIRHGESVKVVQARLGHATAAETLDTYSHLWPDAEDRTRDAVDSVLFDPRADPVRTEGVIN